MADNPNDLGSDDEPMDEEERAAIQAAMELQLAAQRPAPRQLPPPPQAKLLDKLKDQIQKKDQPGKNK